MYALHFGQAPKRMYAAYDPPASGPSFDAVLICPPWGPEWLAAHRTVRTLARRLADRGRHVMRFDYFGTGDSYGEETQLSIDSMVDDVEQAAEECLALAGADRLWLVGLRLGGSLAAMAAANLPEVEGVALWDPILDGARYLESLATGPRGADEDVWDVQGHLLPPAMREDLAALRLDPAATPLLKLVLQHADESGVTDGEHLPVHRYSGARPWVQDGEFGSAPLPAAALGILEDGITGG